MMSSNRNQVIVMRQLRRLGMRATFALVPFWMGAAHAATDAVPVTLAVARGQDVPIIREGLGTVQALKTATIHVQVSGLLERVDFVEGQVLKKGQEIAQVDASLYKAQFDQAVATRERDEAVLANDQRDLERYKMLAATKAVTQQQYDTQTSLVAQARSTIALDDATVAAARTQLGFTTITAPFDGIVGIQLTDIGNIVHPTDTTGLTVVTQVQPITALFTLPSADIPTVYAALGKGPVTAIAYAPDDKRELDRGRLLLINNVADPATGTVQLKAKFPNVGRTLWPGTFVNVHLVVDTRHDGVTVPLAAVQQGPTDPYVYVVGPDDVARMRPVTIGQSRDDRVLVDTGLKAGETVVTDGQYGLVDGSKVAAAGPRAGPVRSSTTASAGMLP